jgi:hypothetical protein
MNSSMAAGQPSTAGESIFTAFREQRAPTNYRWSLVVVIPLLGALATWASVHGQPEPMTVITPRGIKVVHAGMPQPDAMARLGQPIGKESRADGAECFYHGVLSLTEPATTVFLVCYRDGKVTEVMTRRYSMWAADPKGEFTPAGVPWDDAPVVPAQPAPAPTPAP